MTALVKMKSDRGNYAALCSDGLWCMFHVVSGNVHLGHTLEGMGFDRSRSLQANTVCNRNTNQPVRIYLEDWENSLENTLTFLRVFGSPSQISTLEANGRTTIEHL